MKLHITTIMLILAASFGLAGCMVPLGGMPNMGGFNDIASDGQLMQEQQKVSMAYMNSPDTDAWHEQRQQMAQATGDRVFDMDFGRVYDSLVLAVSSLELKVNNMERTSGYIQANGITLPPTEAKAINRQALNDWCKQKGYDSSVFDRQFRSPTYQNMAQFEPGSIMTLAGPSGAKAQKNLTFQLVKMGDNQTKVKLRFSDVNYPPEMDAYYKLVWQAVDKQIFVDKNIEGAVEERK